MARKKTALQIRSQAATAYVDGATGTISPAVVRQQQIDLADRMGVGQPLIYTLEEFGGQGLSRFSGIKTITASVVTKTNSNVLRFGSIGTSGFSNSWAPQGASVTVTSGSGSALPQNMGRFWVQLVSAGGSYLEVVCPAGTAQTGVTYTITYLDCRVSLASYKFDADGNSATTNFDNRQALEDLIGTAVSDIYNGPRDFAVIVALGAKVYPTSGGHSLLGISNLSLRGEGRSRVQTQSTFWQGSAAKILPSMGVGRWVW